MQPPPLSRSAWEILATILPAMGRLKQWQLLRISLEGSTSSHLVGDPAERLDVLDHDAPAPGLDGPGLPEPLHRPANGDALGPEHLPGLQHADVHFLSGFEAVDAHPPFEEQEEYLAPVSGGEDVLAHLEGLGRDAVGDPPQLLLREQREEADPGKERRVILIQPENQLSANYMGFLETPIVSDDTDISTAIGEDFGALGLRRPVCG